MRVQTEFERLFGKEGVYTNAEANTRLKNRIARGPYAELIEQLHKQKISVRVTERKTYEARLQIGTFLGE